MEFLLCDQSVHFNKICSFFLLNSLIVYSVGLNFDCKDCDNCYCKDCKDWILIVRIVTGGMWIFTDICK